MAKTCARLRRPEARRTALIAWIRAIADVVTNAPRVQAMSCGRIWRWTLRHPAPVARVHADRARITALGLGATTAAFSLLDHVLLRPLPFPTPNN